MLQDALTGVVWEDDRWVLPQVMDFDVDKTNPRLEIEIEVLG
ncbi:RusA family crossover junction endodeoxyribonuclease [Alicyclobacillus fastidiosus]|uniref:RusA family crossover junction endodeoxyribonuclease n=1 Tax=Alicyclobacillus fastidiosus TaxID=392011 RepID=A0ABV5ALH9_9BACL|nr:RusA family crossover junction endodeoxyribonuclease [Alicyclobacillus fastidiosus]WEH12016.1 RusA family crossover junction endodeoxyribonuclease [Alicyclobacillus fastidiosus]